MSQTSQEHEASESFLRAIVERIQRYGGSWYEGAIQMDVAGPGGTGQWHIAGDAHAAPGSRDEHVRLVSGPHPEPRWTIACSAQTMRDIAERRFSVRDPKSLAALRITGDALALFDKLGPFLESWPDRFGPREEAAKLTGAASIVEIPTLEEFSVEAIEWAAERLIPVVFERGLRDVDFWKWDIDSLLARCEGVPHTDFATFQETTLSQHLRELIRKPTNNYGAGGLHLHADLKKDVGSLDLFPLRTAEPMLWCSGGGALTSLHRDLTDVLNMQVIGRKRWTLYSPDQAELLYVLPPEEGYQQSRVSKARPDYTRFPAFERARACEIVMGPGRILFNPGGWFHEVSALDLSISLSFGVSYTSRIPRKDSPPAFRARP